VNVASVVLLYCERKIGSQVSTCGAYSLTTLRGPPPCISLVHAELSGRSGAEGPLACGASGLHPQQGTSLDLAFSSTSSVEIRFQQS
jgi:hypothetical protein